MVSIDDFMSDNHGRRFTDVINDTRINFQIVIDFFNDPDRIRRMVESELHHDRPPLAGVIKEFEAVPEIDAFLSGNDAHTTTRFRQVIGVLIKLHMEEQDWETTGRKGSLGTRAKTEPGTTAPGAYRNISGLSKWFTRCERYKRSGNIRRKVLAHGRELNLNPKMVHGSKLFPPDESAFNLNCWWVEIPLKKLERNPHQNIHLLLQKNFDSDDFHHLKIPVRDIMDMEIDLRNTRSGQRFSVILDAEEDLFADLRKGKVKLVQYLMEDE